MKIASMVFVMRRLDIAPKTLGEKLRDLRRGKAVTLEMMERKTHIQKKYLVALERGIYSDLPEPLYTRNFIRAYARALDAEESYFIELYENEVGVCDLVAPMQTPRQRIRRNALFMWHHASRFLFILLFVSAFGTYLVFQVRRIVAPPDMLVLEPVHESITTQATTVVEGIAERESTVFVNGTQVVLSDDATFAHVVELQRGVNTIVVESKKKYSKKSRTERVVVFEPDIIIQ